MYTAIICHFCTVEENSAQNKALEILGAHTHKQIKIRNGEVDYVELLNFKWKENYELFKLLCY